MNNQETNAQESVQPIAFLVKEPIRVLYKPNDEQEGTYITIYPQIDIKTRMQAAERIAETVFPHDAESIEEYAPATLQFEQRYEIVKAFTDFALPENVEDIWPILMYTSIYDTVVRYVGEWQVLEIFKDADCLIEARKENIVHKTEITKLLTAAADKFGEVASQFSKDDIQKLLDVVKQMSDFSPEALVKAVTQAQGMQGNKTE